MRLGLLILLFSIALLIVIQAAMGKVPSHARQDFRLMISRSEPEFT
jgi:hypothetical protein